MRPSIDLRPITLALDSQSGIAPIAGLTSVAILADHSWTPKGWTAAVRPITRRNAVAALVAGIHASQHGNAMETWMALQGADHRTHCASLALAMALPIWGKPQSVREGWSAGDSPNRLLVEEAISRAIASLTTQTLANMDAQACADMEAREAAAIAKGKAAPSPVATVGAAPVHTCAQAAPPKGKGKGKGKVKA
jgi:hypothetical protein